MLRTNLSTRPFYNEHAVHVAIGAAAVVVLALTAFNITRIVGLSRQKTELASRVTRDQSEAQRLTAEAAAIRRAINKDELATVAAAAREANELIDQRTFSWTAFFNYIETTLPPDVMLVAVRPSVKDEQTRISMTVLSRKTEDVEEFIEKLEATGAFIDVFRAQENPTDDGLHRALLESVYTGPGAEPEEREADAAATPAAAPKPGEEPDATNPESPKREAPKPTSPKKPPAGGRP